ncbi:hypothetical protein Ndes2526B_g07297 [Nannochloris sp. 'desiccata']
MCKPQWEIPSLEDVLLVKDKHGLTPLQWAAEVGAAECISVILEKAAATKDKRLFEEVLHAVELGDAPAVFMSVYKADVECIVAFLHGGADFTTACGGRGITIIEYLVHLASDHGVEATYFPILEMVLNYIREKTPEFDLTAPIYYIKEENGAARVASEEGLEVAQEEALVGEEDDQSTNSDSEEEDGGTAPANATRTPRRGYPLRRGRFGYYEVGDYRGGEYVDDSDGDEYPLIYIPGFSEVRTHHSDEKMKFGWAYEERRRILITRHEALREGERWENTHWTLMSIAVRRSAVGLVRLLLDAGALPNYRLPTTGDRDDARGSGSQQRRCEPLIVTAIESIGWEYKSECLATIQLLLDAGEDINAVEEGTKDTALIKAAKFGEEVVVAMLLMNGADPAIKNAKGETVLQIAENGRYPELKALFWRELRLQRLVEVMAAEAENKNKCTDDATEDIQETVKDTVAEDMWCGICWDNPRSVTLAPCGHRRLCPGCAIKVLSLVEDKRKCPFCKASIESYVVQIYD